ncbi:MAG: hypothetical protein RL019_1598, partial [Pseudomonadota bacterium]
MFQSHFAYTIAYKLRIPPLLFSSLLRVVAGYFPTQSRLCCLLYRLSYSGFELKGHVQD